MYYVFIQSRIRCCVLMFLRLSLLWLPLGGGPSLILARHLQHRAEDGGEREETADGLRLPCEDRDWTPRNLPRRAGTQRDGEGWGGVKMEGDGRWDWEEGLGGGGRRCKEEELIPPGWGQNHMVLLVETVILLLAAAPAALHSCQTKL